MAEDNCETFHCHCGKQFKRSSAFRRHQEVAHSTSTSHKCAECGKTFGNANTLTMHMSVHEKREGAFTHLVRPATRSTRLSLRALHHALHEHAALGMGCQQSGASSAPERLSAADIKEISAAGEGKSKRQQQATKHDIGTTYSSNTTTGCSSLGLQSVSDSGRQTRAGAREATINCNTARRASPAAADTSATTTKTPASAEDRDSRAETRARAAEAAAAAAASGREGEAVVGVPGEKLTLPACQHHHQPYQQQQQGAREDGSDRLLLGDEVCNDAAGSLSVEQPGGGRVAAVADKADRSSAEEKEVCVGEREDTQGPGGGRPCAPLPTGRDESKRRVDSTPYGHLIDNANEKCNDARCTQTNQEATSGVGGAQWAGGSSVNNVLSTVGSPCDHHNRAKQAVTGEAGGSDIGTAQGTRHQLAVSCGQGPVSLTPTTTYTTNTALPLLNGCLPPRYALPTHEVRDKDGYDEDGEDEDDSYDGADRPALRKSSRDRKENPIWKTLLTGRMYEEVLSSVDCTQGGPASKHARRPEGISDHYPATPYSIDQQPECGHNITMIPTMVVKQEPMDLGFSLDNIKQEMIETDEETGQLLPEMVALQYQRLKRGPVRRTRSGSMSGGGHVPRTSPTATFDCLVCGKTFISEKYLSMHISLHETAKMEPGVAPGETREALITSNVVCPGQVNPHKVMDDGEVFQPPGSITVDAPNVPTIMEQISTLNNNHFKPSPPKKSSTNTTTNGPTNNSAGSSSSSKKATKLQTDGGWSCSLCNKTFAHNSGYKNHMRTHSNERPYVCHICDIGFKEKYHLKKHNLFIHSNELPEKCRVCGKRFKDSTAVRAHERIHSDERPFACRQCAKTFKTSECLWHHEHRSKTCGMALGEIIAQERLVRRRRRFPKSNGSSGGIQHQSPQSPNSGSDTNPETSPMSIEREANGNLTGTYQWTLQQHQEQHIPPLHQHPHHHHHHQQPQPQHHEQQYSNRDNSTHQPLQHHQHHHGQSHGHQKVAGTDQYVPPVTNFFPTPTSVSSNCLVKEGTSMAKHSLIASQLQACVQPLHSEVTSALHQAPLPPPPNQPQVPLCVEQHNMSPLTPSDDDRLSPTNLAMAMTMKDLNCLNEIPHGMHPHEDEMMVAQSMYPIMSVSDIKQERDAFGYSMDEDEENWVTTNMDKIMDKEDDLIDSKVDAILSNMASSMSSAFGMLANDPLPSPPMPDFTDGKEYRCRICRKSFNELVAYQRHSKVHSDERPFMCVKCDIGFKMKVHLKKHNLYVHSNEYPCECQYCGKKFKDSSAVKLHERTHSDTRPFGCTGCGKAFKTRENLWGHQHRGKCIAARKKLDQDGYIDEAPPSAKASVLNNGMSAHAIVNTNGVTAQACVNNNQVTAHASIENNQLTAHATFANNQFTAHASVVNNQVTAHASITNTNVSAQASISNVKMHNNGTFTYSNSMRGTNGAAPNVVVTSMTDSKSMSGSIPSTTTAEIGPTAQNIPRTTTTQMGAVPPTVTNSFIAQSLMTPPLNKSGGCLTTEDTSLHIGQPQQPQQNASPTAGSLPVTCTTSLPDAGCEPVTTTAQAQDEKSACSKWPTLKEFLSKGIGPPTPVPTWVGPPPKINGQVNINNNNNNNNGEYKPISHDYPALKERLSRNFFSQLPTVVTVAPPTAPTPITSTVNNTSYPSSPASSNLSAPYSGQTTPTAGTSPYGKGRDSVSPYSGDYSPGGSIPSFQSTFLKRTNPPPLAFGNNPMLRGDDPNIPIIYWDDDSDQRPPSSAWTSPESDTMFNDISESVFTQL